ncbi:MAG: nuclear transport factor 2 family protein [Streptococcaceae bacterium]|nr:nuclear transport factor 2 family protein [Streptococcaceae bacterium]
MQIKMLMPLYEIVRQGLGDEVEGSHFWDAVAEEAIFEFMYHFQGFPNKIKGRKAYMDWFAGYDNHLESADGLEIYKSGNVIILEYQVHGHTPAGKPYDNRFCSIITIENRQIVYWKDYMDSLAVFLMNVYN